MSKGIIESRSRRFMSGKVHGVAFVLSVVLLLASCHAGRDRGDVAAAASDVEVGVPEAGELAPAPTRFEMSLDGSWSFVQDPDDLGLEQDWASSIARSGRPPPSAGTPLAMIVPRAFEARQGAGAYDGVVWYWRTVVLPRPLGRRTVLSFERVNHACTVWVNGREVGSHVGGYDPFELDVSDALGDGRKLDVVVRVVDPGAEPVDGMTLGTIPHAKESWYENFGGILGPVTVSGHADVKGRITALAPDPETGQVTVDLELFAPDDGRSRHVEVELRARPLALHAALPVGEDYRPPALAMARHRVRVRDGGERLSMSVQVPGHQLWSPESPWRYLLDLQVHGDDRAVATDDARPFGFRSVQLEAGGFTLNGERLALNGVLYQPHYVGLGGLYPSAEELQAEVLRMLETGFNLVRAHVRPAPAPFLDACDRFGLLVIEEPSIGWVDMSPQLEGWLKHEVEWMVTRDHHHPSIVMWGLFNELSGDAHLLGEPVVQHLLALDDTRPVLEDSGGFFKSRYVPVGSTQRVPMLDEHIYPPCPIPFDERQRMRTLTTPSGPALVSEYGYGTLMDAESDVAEFERRNVLGVERNTFIAMLERTRQSLEAGDTWDPLAWLEEAPRVHSGMSVDMLELLRSNGHLVGNIYTQWQAVSSESSAGLLDPWGHARPALGAIAGALAPLQVNVFPARASSTQEGLLRVDVAVVNDTGAALEGSVVLDAEGAVRDADGAVGRGFDPQVFPPGVTHLSEEAFRATEPGQATFRAYLVDAGGELAVTSRAIPHEVVPPAPGVRALPSGGEGPATPIALVSPEGGARLAGFAAREGFEVRELLEAGESLPVVILEDPGNLGESMSTADQLRMWRFVFEGGAAVVMVGELPEDHIGRLAGSLRGIRLLPHVPVRFGIGLSAGNFMGRCHVVIQADEPERPGGPLPFVFEELDGGSGVGSVPPGAHARLLQSHEASLSPAAMIVGALPEGTRAAAITLNHYRARAGAAIASMPYGSGRILYVGFPLLDPIAGEPDPLRDRLLSGLIETIAQEVRAETPTPQAMARPLPLSEDQLEEYARGMEQLSRMSELSDRYSFITSGRMAPASLGLGAVVVRDQALSMLFRGKEGAWEHLRSAVAGAWTEETARFVEREEDILERLKRLIRGATPEVRILAAQVVQEWGHGVLAWVHGEHELAYARMDAADALLQEDPPR